MSANRRRLRLLAGIVPATLAACAAAAAAAAGAGDAPAAAPPRVGAPTVVNDGAAPMSVDIGHAAPFVVDWDGDGRQDLLVGQFGGGTVRLYRDRGGEAGRAFDGYELLKAGGEAAKVPAG